MTAILRGTSSSRERRGHEAKQGLAGHVLGDELAELAEQRREPPLADTLRDAGERRVERRRIDRWTEHPAQPRVAGGLGHLPLREQLLFELVARAQTGEEDLDVARRAQALLV